MTHPFSQRALKRSLRGAEKRGAELQKRAPQYRGSLDDLGAGAKPANRYSYAKVALPVTRTLS